MTHHWDEFSKSLAEQSVPRRQSLRLLGAALAGALLSPLGLGSALAATRDPCKAFCRCRNKSQQSQCLSACRACNSDPRRLCGTCGSYACCAAGTGCCSGYCTDLASDFDNCGACDYVCQQPGRYEEGACISGRCEYSCFEGAVNCGGTCTFLDDDLENCGACGNVCQDAGPNGWNACVGGQCVYGCASGAVDCGGLCTFLDSDPSNCGACGNVCGGSIPYCYQGACISCADGTICDGQCVDLLWDPNNCGACGVVCPSQTTCAFGECVSPCPGGGTFCSGVCTNTSFDTLNCGGCGIRCGDGQTCSGGVCQYPW